MAATSWRKKLASLHTVGRKLEDGAMYIIDLEDMSPAGILVQAYKQETSDRYTLSVSEGEVGRVAQGREREGCSEAHAVDSLHACLGWFCCLQHNRTTCCR